MSEVICEWKGKLNSIKLIQFGSADSTVKYEMGWIGEVSGRLNGQEMGPDYLSVAPDGTGITAYYGVSTPLPAKRCSSKAMGRLLPSKEDKYVRESRYVSELLRPASPG